MESLGEDEEVGPCLTQDWGRMSGGAMHDAGLGEDKEVGPCMTNC